VQSNDLPYLPAESQFESLNMKIQIIFTKYVEFCNACAETLLGDIDTPSPMHLQFLDLQFDSAIQDPIALFEDIKGYVDGEPSASNVWALTAVTSWLFDCRFQFGRRLCWELRSWISKKQFCTPELQLLLARSLTYGQGCDIDCVAAIRAYELCIFDGVTQSDCVKSTACVELAWLYLLGRGSEVNTDVAIHLLEMADELNDSESAFVLGELYEGRLGKFAGLRRSFKRAADYYARAAMQGHVRANTNFGLLHWNKKLPESDVRVAWSCLVDASLQKDVEALSWVSQHTGVPN
jgi:hypothetical protein